MLVYHRNLVLVAVLGAAACSEEGSIGDRCNFQWRNPDADEIDIDHDNPDCESGECISILGNRYCTDHCSSEDDCPSDMTCMPMAVVSGVYCIRVEGDSDLDAGDPHG